MDKRLIKRIITISIAILLFGTIFNGCSNIFRPINEVVKEKKKENVNKKKTFTTEEQKTLCVAMEIGFPPYETFEKDGSTPKGFDVDLMKEIGKRLGYRIKFLNVAFDGILDGIDVNYDVVCSAVSITEDREKYHLFSIPYHTDDDDNQLGIAMGKNNYQLRSDINRVLSDMKQDGTLKRLEDKWFD